MNPFRRLWWRWQLETLRARFPEWSIIRREADVWDVYRAPVRRVIIGPLQQARDELCGLEKGFQDGVYQQGDPDY